MTGAQISEKLNGAASLVSLIFVCWIVFYLIREKRRRNLGLRDLLFHLPEHMIFASAVGFYDIAVTGKSSAIWIWRKYFGSGPFPPVLFHMLQFFTLMIVIGALCKIGAITKPEYGHSPWISCALLVLMFFILI